ncbi:MAG: hypothetical protein K8S55_07535 [Phycisphaerae bacterium]|nr:hypothetical protein [Phycisphaerae bacterium]
MKEGFAFFSPGQDPAYQKRVKTHGLQASHATQTKSEYRNPTPEASREAKQTVDCVKFSCLPARNS